MPEYAQGMRRAPDKARAAARRSPHTVARDRTAAPDRDPAVASRVTPTIQLQRLLAGSPRVADLARIATVLQRQARPVMDATGHTSTTVQRKGLEEEEEIVQGRFDTSSDTVQRESMQEEGIVHGGVDVVQRAPNRTGMPDHLKTGVETLSGEDLSDVRVHRNSAEPASVSALAYASGNDIHLAPGQEQHLAHEAWHVVQQRQGRVTPTTRIADVAVNDDVRLETEADVMARRALQRG